eukprot:15451289-Alexandrium_andersonii.AAC.1
MAPFFGEAEPAGIAKGAGSRSRADFYRPGPWLRCKPAPCCGWRHGHRRVPDNRRTALGSEIVPGWRRWGPKVALRKESCRHPC